MKEETVKKLADQEKARQAQKQRERDEAEAFEKAWKNLCDYLSEEAMQLKSRGVPTSVKTGADERVRLSYDTANRALDFRPRRPLTIAVGKQGSYGIEVVAWNPVEGINNLPTFYEFDPTDTTGWPWKPAATGGKKFDAEHLDITITLTFLGANG
jgi:hypothetical protein